MTDNRVTQSIREIEFLRSELIKAGETIEQLRRSGEVLGAGLLTRDQTIKDLREVLKAVLPIAESILALADQNQAQEDKIIVKNARKLIEP